MDGKEAGKDATDRKTSLAAATESTVVLYQVYFSRRLCDWD